MKTLLIAAVLVPVVAAAVEYDCKVERKVDTERVYSAEQLRTGRFSVRVVEDGSTATIARCSASPSTGALTCDSYDVDNIVADETQTVDARGAILDDKVKIKKYYRFVGQLDVQIFPNLTFVENNGRGGIAFGKCRVVSP